MGFLAAAAPYAAPIIGAVGGAVSGAIGAGGNQETKLQRQRRKLIDDLISSLKGQGSFNELFDVNEEAFQKSIVDPAKSRFQNQISPQIRQQFINSGLQRGTGLDDELMRAGVDMDSMINQEYMKFYQSAMDRKMNALNSAMGGTEAGPQQSAGQGAAQGAAGYFASSGFQNSMDSLLKDWNKPSVGGGSAPRKGYVDESLFN